MSGSVGRVADAELAGPLLRGATELSLPLSTAQVDRLVAYLRLIERWNATYNLTAVRDPREMVSQHLLDCLAAGAALFRRRAAAPTGRVLDVGSGAGLPGLVLGFMAPTWQVVCIDSVGKKAAFITQAAGTLGLGNVTVVHGRVEGLSPPLFDVVVSRAFSSLRELVTTTSRLLADDGLWMAMKGRVPSRELEALNAGTFHVERLSVPGLVADRCIVWIEKPKLEASAHL